MRAYERLLRYAVVNTTSYDDREGTPTGEGQFVLARLLAVEMETLGLERRAMSTVPPLGLFPIWIPWMTAEEPIPIPRSSAAMTAA